jgi:hypothetical protein
VILKAFLSQRMTLLMSSTSVTAVLLGSALLLLLLLLLLLPVTGQDAQVNGAVEWNNLQQTNNTYSCCTSSATGDVTGHIRIYACDGIQIYLWQYYAVPCWPAAKLSKVPDNIPCGMRIERRHTHNFPLTSRIDLLTAAEAASCSYCSTTFMLATAADLSPVRCPECCVALLPVLQHQLLHLSCT